MIARLATGPVTAGVGLTALYTLLISSADGITKLFAANYAAPQLFALSGGIVALLSFLVNRKGTRPRNMRTSCPIAMTIRVLATIGGTIAFFYAFRLLPFAEVFLFIALIPLLAALMSGPILGEAVRPQIWAALALGSVGVMCLFPSGLGSIGVGHLIALAGRDAGDRVDGGITLHWETRRQPTGTGFLPKSCLDAGDGCRIAPLCTNRWHLLIWAGHWPTRSFSSGARWVLVAALKMLPAFVVTPLMNLQFLWMVAIGILIFGEMPGAMVFVGAAIIIAAGAWLILRSGSA